MEINNKSKTKQRKELKLKNLDMFCLSNPNSCNLERGEEEEIGEPTT